MHVKPMLATLVDKPFDDDEWSFEIKWDGVRAICEIDGDRMTLTSRNGNSLLAQFPELRAVPNAFTSRHVVLDGEIVSLDRAGRSSFQRLQGRLNRSVSSPALERSAPATYVVFDLLRLGAKDLRGEPLDVRQGMLKKILRPRAPHVRLSRRVIGRGRELFARAKRLSLEGIMAKRRDSRYVATRSRDWLKIKAVHEQEVVVGGWTEPRGSREDFGALLVGYYRGGRLIYAGRVGGGFDRRGLADMMARLARLASSRSPFADPPKAAETMHWVRPHLVVEVKFGEWTRDGLMRQPIFLGLRTDKAAKSVVRETPRNRS